jgi:hypothetical protein
VLLYLTILSVAFAGLMQMPSWTAAVGAVGLSAVIASDKLAGRLSPIGSFRSRPESVEVLAVLFNGTAAAAASFAIGRLTAWLWGI